MFRLWPDLIVIPSGVEESLTLISSTTLDMTKN